MTPADALAELQRLGARVVALDDDRITVTPSVPVPGCLVAALTAQRDRSLAILRGRACRGCGAHEAEEVGYLVTPYWSEGEERYCGPCAATLATELDVREAWPPVPWIEIEHTTEGGEW